MISARIANRRARAIQRGYLQGVPRGYKQILVPEELVGGIKLMLKGKQLHEELNAANGACTHYLSQAIWDAYRKGIISVSQRRTLLRVNKAANLAKHQSSLHGTVGNVVDKQELSLAELLDGPADSRLFSLQSAAFNVLYGDFSVDAASRGISMEALSPVAHAGWHDDLGLDVTDVTVENNFDSLLDGSVLHEEGTLHDDHRPVVTDFTVENNLDLCNELDDVRKALAEESAKGSLLSGSDVHEDLDQDSLLDGSVLHEALTEDSVKDPLLVGSALHEDESLHEALTEDSVHDSLLTGSFLHENGTLHDDHRPVVADFTVENNLAIAEDSLLDGSVLHVALTEDSVQDSLQVGSTLHEDEILHEALTEDSVQDSLLVGSTLHVDATLHDSASSAFAGPLHEKELHVEKVDNEAFARWADVFSSDEDDDFEHELHGHSDSDVIGVSPEFQWQLVDGRWQKFGFSGQRELTCSPDPTLHGNDGDFKDDNSAVVSKFALAEDSALDRCNVSAPLELEKSPIAGTLAKSSHYGSGVDLQEKTDEHLVPFFVPCEVVATVISSTICRLHSRALLNVAYCKAACNDNQSQLSLWKRRTDAALALLRKHERESAENFTQWTDGFKSSFQAHLLALKDAHRQELEDLKVAHQGQKESILGLNRTLIRRLQETRDMHELQLKEQIADQKVSTLHVNCPHACGDLHDSLLHDGSSADLHVDFPNLHSLDVLHDGSGHAENQFSDHLHGDVCKVQCETVALKERSEDEYRNGLAGSLHEGSGHAGTQQKWGRARHGKRCFAQSRMKRYKFSNSIVSKAHGSTEPSVLDAAEVATNAVLG